MNPPANPFAAVSSLIHGQVRGFFAELAARAAQCTEFIAAGAAGGACQSSRRRLLPFGSISVDAPPSKERLGAAVGVGSIAKTLAGTSVYAVSNSDNQFVLISDPGSVRCLSLLCFRPEDAEALLAQVQLQTPVLGKGARVVPITLDQVYMLKVEGIAFRFLPDPSQIKNALELVADHFKRFDGVPVFQSDVLVAKKNKRQYYPVYFQKEDVEKDLLKVPRAARGSSFAHHIMVGSLEDVLKKMEIGDKECHWEDVIFIPPGQSYNQHLKIVD